MARIMVIAGTGDGRELARELISHGEEVFATVATEYGKELLEGCPGLKAHAGRLSVQDMISFVKENRIACLVDSSHPFAREVSVNAIEASRAEGIPYIRFERESVLPQSDKIISVKDFEEAAEIAVEMKGNIFLAIGSNNLSIFIKKLKDYKERLFARILPDSRMMARCEEAGLTADNIIAVKGPFSVEMNMEMLKHCKASVLVTKESGEAGGTREKLEAADRLGISVIMVKRPEISYGRKVSTIAEVMRYVKEEVQKHRSEN